MVSLVSIPGPSSWFNNNLTSAIIFPLLFFRPCRLLKHALSIGISHFHCWNEGWLNAYNIIERTSAIFFGFCTHFSFSRLLWSYLVSQFWSGSNKPARPNSETFRFYWEDEKMTSGSLSSRHLTHLQNTNQSRQSIRSSRCLLVWIVPV